MDGNAITSTQAIQAILAPAVMISSSALFFLGLSARYIALLTRIRLLNDEKRNLNKLMTKQGQLDESDNIRLLHIITQVNILLRAAWFVRNAIMCQVLAVICFVLTSLSIGINFFFSTNLIQGLPLYLFTGGMFLVLGGVTCMVLDIFISYRVIIIEVKDEH
ncbi:MULTISPECIES: DUF2721 domain-containing protein [Aerosakkonema]|uniref:DUF2721 domain-containing protein n=1 Tax=Aerosakkonema TaxID=1246629 RepID=UPI0035B701E7